MDNISIEVIFVLIIMVVSAIKWVAENVLAKKGGPPPLDGEGGGSTLEDLYEEARREIQERQARVDPEVSDQWVERPSPPQAIPPPLPPRAHAPPTPAQVPAPSAYDILSEVRKPSLSSAEKTALEQMRKRERKTSPRNRRRGEQSDLRSLLTSPSAARNAILLREILGPPKGAREMQDHLA